MVIRHSSFPLCSLCLLLLSLACSAGTVDSFENLLPGTRPPHWVQTWGSMANDVFYVTNLDPLHGHGLLLIDHDAGSPRNQWGLARSWRGVLTAPGTLTIPFRYEGAGQAAWFSFELRTPKGHRRLAVIQIRGHRVHLNDGHFKSVGILGDTAPMRWFRVRATWHDATIQLVLEQPDGDTWSRVGDSLELPMAPADDLELMVVTGPRAFPYRVYLDDVTLEP